MTPLRQTANKNKNKKYDHTTSSSFFHCLREEALSIASSRTAKDTSPVVFSTSRGTFAFSSTAMDLLVQLECEINKGTIQNAEDVGPFLERKVNVKQLSAISNEMYEAQMKVASHQKQQNNNSNEDENEEAGVNNQQQQFFEIVNKHQLQEGGMKFHSLKHAKLLTNAVYGHAILPTKFYVVDEFANLDYEKILEHMNSNNVTDIFFAVTSHTRFTSLSAWAAATRHVGALHLADMIAFIETDTTPLILINIKKFILEDLIYNIKNVPAKTITHKMEMDWVQNSKLHKFCWKTNFFAKSTGNKLIIKKMSILLHQKKTRRC